MAAAESLVGLPFELGARGDGSTDCGGMLLRIAQRVGLEWADLRHEYTVLTSAGITLYCHLRTVCDEIRPESRQPGSILLFWIRHSNHPRHLGIWTGKRLVHAAPESTGGVRSQYLGAFGRRIFATFDFRLPGAEPRHEVELNRFVGCPICVAADPARYAQRSTFGVAVPACEHRPER